MAFRRSPTGICCAVVASHGRRFVHETYTTCRQTRQSIASIMYLGDAGFYDRTGFSSRYERVEMRRIELAELLRNFGVPPQQRTPRPYVPRPKRDEPNGGERRRKPRPTSPPSGAPSRFRKSTQLETMNASVLVKHSGSPNSEFSGGLRGANCVSFRVSNPHLRLGPGKPHWLPDERVESIER